MDGAEPPIPIGMHGRIKNNTLSMIFRCVLTSLYQGVSIRRLVGFARSELHYMQKYVEICRKIVQILFKYSFRVFVFDIRVFVFDIRQMLVMNIRYSRTNINLIFAGAYYQE